MITHDKRNESNKLILYGLMLVVCMSVCGRVRKGEKNMRLGMGDWEKKSTITSFRIYKQSSLEVCKLFWHNVMVDVKVCTCYCYTCTLFSIFICYPNPVDFLCEVPVLLCTMICCNVFLTNYYLFKYPVIFVANYHLLNFPGGCCFCNIVYFPAVERSIFLVFVFNIFFTGLVTFQILFQPIPSLFLHTIFVRE